MAKEYRLKKITTETYITSCKKCGRVFRSDVKEKAVERVMNHYKDKHGGENGS